MKKRLALVIAILLFITVSIPASAASAQLENSEGATSSLKSLGYAEQLVVKYAAKLGWFEELYSNEFNTFAVDFMLGDKYQNVFSDISEYRLVREYFANYISLIDGQTEAGLLQLKQDISSCGIDVVVSTANEELSARKAQRSSIARSDGTLSYNSESAIRYAWDNALVTTNVPYYGGLFQGGDCTNFVSKCIYNGGIPYTSPSIVSIGNTVETTLFWYCFVSPGTFRDTVSISTSHIRVGDFITYWEYDVDTIFVETKAEVYQNVIPGDVVFLASGDGVPYHATIITGKDADRLDLLYCAHSNERLDESFNEAVSNEDTFLILKFTNL